MSLKCNFSGKIITRLDRIEAVLVPARSARLNKLESVSLNWIIVIKRRDYWFKTDNVVKKQSDFFFMAAIGSAVLFCSWDAQLNAGNWEWGVLHRLWNPRFRLSLRTYMDLNQSTWYGNWIISSTAPAPLPFPSTPSRTTPCCLLTRQNHRGQ